MTYAYSTYGGGYRLPVPGVLLFRCVVLGDPISQGSKSFKGFTPKGRAIMAESSKRHKPWRAHTKDEVTKALHGETPMYDCPLILGAQFVRNPPKAKKELRERFGMSTTMPDLSKLVRSVEDSLKDAGLIKDDARIVDEVIQKRYIGDPTAMLSEPGVVLLLWRHPGYDIDAKPLADQSIPLFD